LLQRTRRKRHHIDQKICIIFDKNPQFPRKKSSQSVFSGLRQRLCFGILLRRGIAIFDCEAAALPGRFLPELGRSSERPFFLADLLQLGGVAASLIG
jgi:hypothetical protein